MSIGTLRLLVIILADWFLIFCLFWRGATTIDRGEVVIPKILYSKGDSKFPQRVIYMISGKKATFVLRLKRNKDLVPDNFRLDFGNGRTSLPEKESLQCYYQGKLKNLIGVKHRSRVIISACNGLHGVIEKDDDIYYIRPQHLMPRAFDYGYIPSNTTNPIESLHFLYNMTSLSGDGATTMNCKAWDGKFWSSMKGRIQDSSHLRFKRSHQGNRTNSKRLEPNLGLETRYLELYLVNDYSMFVHYGRNASFLEHRSKLIANILDSRFRVLKVRVVLVGVEVWTDKERIELVDDSVDSLRKFLLYRSTYINRKYQNDNAQLITRRSFDKASTAGKAPIGTVCSWRYSGGVNQDTNDNPLYIATVIAHELGHNLGMKHDDSCSCRDHPEKKCIMSQILDPRVRSFSSCSRASLARSFENGQGQCLFNFPMDKKLLPTCGNGILEIGEVCDCGTYEQCMKTNKCCNPDTCMLREGATCSEGKCCMNCVFIRAGTPCRSKVSECDLPEYCTGYSENCPNDVHVQDGQSCAKNSAYCQNGTCLSHNSQCHSHFGNLTRSARPQCYPLLNERGSYDGNCGMRGKRFKKCAPKHALCGTLQCSVERAISLPERSVYLSCLVDQFRFDGEHIQTVLVENGTKCGEEKLCISNKCVSFKSFPLFQNLKECPKNCSGRGICNSNSNCHCDSGWSPPYCDRPGSGGSVDSGNPMSLRKYKKKPKRLKDIGKPVTVFITVGLVCAVVFVLAVTKFSFRRICQSMTKREHERNRTPRGELRDVLERH